MTGRTPSARQLWRQIAPFVAAAMLAFFLVALTARVDAMEYGAALALTVAVIAMTVWLPWRRLQGTARIGPAMVFLLSASLLRDSAGGVASGVGTLALLPVFWVALHGTRRHLSIVLAGVAAYYLAPIVLVGGTAYPTSGYRTAVLFVVISSIIGFTVQRLVDQVRAQAQQAERHRRDLQRVAAVSRRIATSPDARMDVCRSACEISEATFAVLLEADGQDGLTSTAMAGLEAQPFGAAPASQRSAPRIALTSRRPVFIADAARSPLLNRALWAEHGRPASMLFEPVLRGDSAVGVLVVAWADPVADERRPAIISLLATEAGIAIERADLVEQLTGLAHTDALTGLRNRRAWDAHLEHVITAGANVERPLCVAMLDLDNFKAFNDAHGHQSGDRLLKEAAAAWRAVLRPGDLLVRFGGEEFAVLLPDCTESCARPVLERMRDATPGRETCSAGVAQWDGCESADELVGRADAALYAAKAAGRDQTVAAGAQG